MITQLKYCYVTGGIRNLNFHAWLNEITIDGLSMAIHFAEQLKVGGVNDKERS